jgi:hypothetical protein
MPTFVVALNLKQLVWQAAVNRFLPYSDSRHVAVNSDIKHSIPCMEVLSVAMLDVTMHDVALHDVAVHCTGVYCMSMHGMNVTAVKKNTNICCPFKGKNSNFFLLFVAE